MIVVVDTTVWIDFFVARGTIFDRHLAELIESDAPIVLVDRRTVDCRIAAICLEAGAEIYHNDRDYDALAKVSTLRIHRPA